jgi:membrane-associated phospholipid phosphatase
MDREDIAYRLSQAFHPAIIEIPAAILALHIYGLATKEILYFAVLPIAGITAAIYAVLELPRFKGLDMNIKDDRQLIYPPATILLGISAGLTYLFNGPAIIQALYIGTIAIALANYVINRKVKISLHTTGMGVVTAIFTSVSLGLGGLFFMASGFVGWSRVVLDRHTPLEAALGFLVSYSFILASTTI